MPQTINIVLNAIAAGTVDAITVAYSPAISAYTDKRILAFRASGANTSTTPTIAVNGLPAKTIVKKGNQALVAGDIPGASAPCFIQFDSTLDKFVLMNPGGVSPLSDVLTAGNQANQDIDMGGNNITNTGGMVDATGNFYMTFNGALYTVITTDAEGYTTPFLFLQPGAEAAIGYDMNRGFQATAASSNVKHDILATLDAPAVRLPNETASRWLYLDANKDFDTKTDAEMSAAVTANLTVGYQGYTLQGGLATAALPADSTTYYFGMTRTVITTGDGVSRIIFPKAATIKRIDVFVRNGIAGTSENVAYNFRLNSTTDTSLGNVTWDAMNVTSSFTGLSIPVVAGDFGEMKIVTPAWSVNPTNTTLGFIWYLE